MMSNPLSRFLMRILFALGAGENEFAVGAEKVAGIFRSFKSQVPKCNISDEYYVVLELAPEVYLCSGHMWIAADASTKISLRVHQRICFSG